MLPNRLPKLLLFSHYVVSDSLQPHELQHTRLPCPSPSPEVCSNLCPLSWWCHLPISSSVDPFSSHPQSFPASGSFPVSQLLASGSQSIGASASGSVLPMNVQGWFPLGLTCLTFLLLFKGLSRVFSISTIWKHQFFGTYPFWGFPDSSVGKQSTCNVPGFDPWVGKMPWRREWLPTPVFWPGEVHGLYNPWGHKELDMTERLSLTLF